MNTFDLTYAYITIIQHAYTNVEKGVVEKGGLINSQEPICLCKEVKRIDDL